MSRERVRAPIDCRARVLYTDNGSGGIFVCPAKNRICVIAYLQREGKSPLEVLDSGSKCSLGRIVNRDIDLKNELDSSNT